MYFLLASSVKIKELNSSRWRIKDNHVVLSLLFGSGSCDYLFRITIARIDKTDRYAGNPEYKDHFGHETHKGGMFWHHRHMWSQ